MKIAVYNYREFDEGQYFEKFSQHYCVEIIKYMIHQIKKMQF